MERLFVALLFLSTSSFADTVLRSTYSTDWQIKCYMDCYGYSGHSPGSVWNDFTFHMHEDYLGQVWSRSDVVAGSSEGISRDLQESLLDNIREEGGRYCRRELGGSGVSNLYDCTQKEVQKSRTPTTSR